MIAAGGDAYLALTVGDMREILGTADVASELGAVARVGREHDGNAKSGAFGDLLHFVGPVGEFLWRCYAVVEDAAEVLLLDVGLGGGGAAHLAHSHRTGVLPARADRSGIALFLRPAEGFFLLVAEVVLDLTGLVDGDVGMEHQSDFLLEGHLGDQVGDAFIHREAPVLVRIHLTVLVEVLETVFAFGQDLRFAGAEFRLGVLRGAPRGEDQEKGRSQNDGSVHIGSVIRFTQVSTKIGKNTVQR